MTDKVKEIIKKYGFVLTSSNIASTSPGIQIFLEYRDGREVVLHIPHEDVAENELLKFIEEEVKFYKEYFERRRSGL